MTNNLIDELRWRGLLFDMTEGIESALLEGSITAYIGFDPTSDSLHIGSLLPIMALVRLQKFGHKPIALVGGATGMIGDPSGKSKERNLLTNDLIEHNVSCIRNQLARFLDFDCEENPAMLVNNADWIGPMSFISFMRDVGKHFPMGYMLAKESVKRRIDGDGISFTEFSYMLLQAYDFYYLRKNHNCILQMGGSDQWGNITAGIELTRRIDESKGHGVVMPLVTTSSGQKFGKTEEGAVWLDAKRTSPYKFYQFWLNVTDDDAIRYLKFFTLLDQETIEGIEKLQQENPAKRDAQKTLAAEVTRLVHGQDALDGAIRATEVMFGGDLGQLSAADIEGIFGELSPVEIARERFEGEGFPIFDLFLEVGAVKSKGEARRLMQNGGVNLNNIRINEVDKMVRMTDTIENTFVVLRKGKKDYRLVKILD